MNLKIFYLYKISVYFIYIKYQLNLIRKIHNCATAKNCGS